MEETTKEEEE